MFLRLMGSSFLTDKYLSAKKVDPNLPALKELSGKPSADEITEEVESVFGEDRALARGVKIYLCHKHTGKMLKEIGRQFDIGASGVSQTSRRIAMKISQDSKLSKKIRKIENKLNRNSERIPRSLSEQSGDPAQAGLRG